MRYARPLGYGVIIGSLERTKDGSAAVGIIVAITHDLIFLADLHILADLTIKEQQDTAYIPCTSALVVMGWLTQCVATRHCSAAGCNTLSEGKTLNDHAGFYIGLFQCDSPPSQY